MSRLGEWQCQCPQWQWDCTRGSVPGSEVTLMAQRCIFWTCIPWGFPRHQWGSGFSHPEGTWRVPSHLRHQHLPKEPGCAFGENLWIGCSNSSCLKEWVFFLFCGLSTPNPLACEDPREPEAAWNVKSVPTTVYLMFIWCLSAISLQRFDFILARGDNWLPVSTTDKPSPCGMWGFSFCPQRSHTPSEVSSHVVSQGASTTCTPQIHQPARAEQNSRLINLPAIMRPRSTSLWDKTTSASCCRRGIFFPLFSFPFSFFSFYSLFFSLFELQKWQEGKIWDCPGWSFSTAWLHCSDWETWTTAGTHAGVLGKKLGEKTPPQ